MKLIRRLVLAVVLLVIVVVVVIYLKLDGIIKSVVQTQATSSLNLATTLNSANLSLFGGKLDLNQLAIASPSGYTAPQMLGVGDTQLAVSYGQLRDDPIHVSQITIDKPMLVIEQKNGELNFKKAMDDMPKGDATPSTPSSGSSTSSNSKPIKLIIDDLKLTNPQVVIKGIGVTDIPVTLPSLELKNIGNGDGANNGAAVKDVVMQIITSMAASASNSDALSAEFKQILNANLTATLSQFSSEAQKRIAAAVPGQIGQSLSKLVSDPQALIKNPGSAVQNLLGGKGSTTQPSGGDIKSQAQNALQGLLGGKK